MTVGDFNKDGAIDLVVASDSIYVLLGNGIGSFATTKGYGNSNGFVSVTNADFNGDTHDDIAAINGYDSLYILLGTGTGNFNVYSGYNVGVDCRGYFILKPCNWVKYPKLLLQIN